MPEVTIDKETFIELKRQGGLTDYLASNDIYILTDNAKDATTTTDKHGNITFRQGDK